MLATLNLLPRNHAADGGDAREHDVGQLLHEEVCQRQVKPGVQNGEASRDNRADKKDGAEQAQHALKVRQDTLPLLGVFMTQRGKHPVIVDGFLTKSKRRNMPRLLAFWL
jgi:hypothetical protein